MLIFDLETGETSSLTHMEFMIDMPTDCIFVANNNLNYAYFTCLDNGNDSTSNVVHAMLAWNGASFDLHEDKVKRDGAEK